MIVTLGSYGIRDVKEMAALRPPGGIILTPNRDVLLLTNDARILGALGEYREGECVLGQTC